MVPGAALGVDVGNRHTFIPFVIFFLDTQAGAVSIRE
jgi:hypothetical protein